MVPVVTLTCFGKSFSSCDPTPGRCFRALLREEVARTVVDPRDVDEELGNLFESLGN